MSFIKWIGGKGNVLPELEKLLPPMNKIKGYIEPFLGSAAVYFFLKENYLDKECPCYLSDYNPELINLFRVVRDNPQELMSKLDNLYEKHNEKFFFILRKAYPPGTNMSDVEKAACMVYLNKTCFNGQWRVNSQGKFNTGIGHPEKVALYDKKEIEKCSSLLQNAKLNCISYEKSLQINKGNLKDWFVYYDVPYDGTSKGYTTDGFGVEKRGMLKRTFDILNEKECYVMLSNSKNSLMNTEFKKYYIHTIMADRTHAAKASSRGKVEEYVITNYKPEKKKTILDY